MGLVRTQEKVSDGCGRMWKASGLGKSDRIADECSVSIW